MKKRILLTALALILVCALSIMGTVAFLEARTNTVTNTFVAAGGGKLIEDGGTFTLQEHEISKVMIGEGDAARWAGTYEITEGAKTTNANSYDVMPNMILPKDPYISITGKTAAPVYLYVTIKSELDEKVFTWDVTNSWLDLEITTADGGKVYAYTKDTSTAALLTDADAAALANIAILDNNQITVADADDVAGLKLEADKTMVFNAYMAQASIGEETGAAAIFNACFGNQGGQGEAPTPDPDPEG